jgi:xylan 1,4-beta-xylosidase
MTHPHASVPPFHGNISFNAHHSPMGAYFSFTCGHLGTRGGLAAQLGKPGNQDLYIGVKLGSRYEHAPIRCLPFFEGAGSLIRDGAGAFVVENAAAEKDQLSAYSAREISRHYAWATDTWKTADFEFSIYTPFASIPGPAQASDMAMRSALLPAVTAELLIDNRDGKSARTAFFAVNFNEGGARILDQGLPASRVGFALRSHYGVAAEAVEMRPDGISLTSAESGIHPFAIMRWSVQQGLEDRSNPVHLLGSVPGVAVEVPPGKCVILRLALGCYLGGIVTTRLEGRYLYTRYFTGLTDVLNEALASVRSVKTDCNNLNDRLAHGGGAGLNPDQQFFIAHATRSYYGNTQLLEVDGQPYWIVNEGEYCMMNTLDLAVDQMFWELKWNPWVVRNLLDQFTRHYSYHDQVKLPAQEGNAAQAVAPGGISFCHDQGEHNQFSPFGQSSYELTDLTGCFSYMTQEELCNWVLLATSYVATTGDTQWAQQNAGTIRECMTSMMARREKEGDMLCYDSSKCGTGQEITSYDSLDTSLGQARSNTYMAAKCWAAYLGLGLIGYAAGDSDTAHLAGNEIEKLEWALAAIVRERKMLPAVYEKDSSALDSRILPAVEGLIYAMFWNNCPHIIEGARRKRLVSLDEVTPLEGALRQHLVTLLSDAARRNAFPEGGVRLSSTSDNSWLSKIAIVQHVARDLFNLDENGKERGRQGGARGWEKADAAHVKWLTEGDSAYWAASDQFVSGVARGSRYYPRLISAVVWLKP